MANAPSASYSLTVRVRLANRPGMLGKLTSAIGKAGGDIGAVDLVEAGLSTITRDISFKASDERHGERITERLRAIAGADVVNVSDRTFLMHLGGKIEITSKMPLKTRSDLSMAYTPGVARVCEAIHRDPEKVFNLTIKKNTVAVVTDGTAILGLGDLGPAAALPVMEGKCQLFKEFGGVDAFPVCLSTKDPHEIVQTIKVVADAEGAERRTEIQIAAPDLAAGGFRQEDPAVGRREHVPDPSDVMFIASGWEFSRHSRPGCTLAIAPDPSCLLEEISARGTGRPDSVMLTTQRLVIDGADRARLLSTVASLVQAFRSCWMPPAKPTMPSSTNAR